MTLHNRIMLLVLFLAAAAALRLYYARDIPLLGDEVVSLLQATGQGLEYNERIPQGVFDLQQVQALMQYNPDRSAADVTASLRYGGMHPPGYYVLLHYVMRFAGNEALTLRLVSILFSLGSVVCVYFLGRELFGRKAGLYSAFFMAISAYAVKWSAMVRPYPPTMFLGLVSLLLALRLSGRGRLIFKDPVIWLWVCTAVAGLYTIYHFIFVVVFQVVLLAACHRHRLKSLGVLAVAVAAAGILYLPWLPALVDQLAAVTAGEYYFHGRPSIYGLVNSAVRLNFATRVFEKMPGRVVNLTLAAAVCAIILAGCYRLWKNGLKRNFLVALVVYVALYYAADLVMHSKTLTVSTLLFFVIPVSLLLLAGGAVSIPRNYGARAASIILICVLLGLKTAGFSYARPLFIGPEYIPAFRCAVKEYAGADSRELVLINVTQRRGLLAFVHSLPPDIEMGILEAPRLDETLLCLAGENRYDVVFLANCYLPYGPGLLGAEEVARVQRYLESKDFVLRDRVVVDESRLYIFEKAVPATDVQ